MASYVDPSIREKFETLSVDLKNAILERNVRLNSIHDLIRVLEEIVAEGSWRLYYPLKLIALFFSIKSLNI